MHPRWSVSLIVPPASEPVSVAEAKLWLRIDSTDEDSLIAGLLAMARNRVERMTGRALVEQTLEFRLSRFADVLYLPRSPIIEISEVAYLDGEGVSQTLDPASWTLDASEERPALSPATGTDWPSITEQPNAVTVTAVCGFGDAADVPADLKHAIALIVADAYANREGEGGASDAVEALISSYRLNWLA